MVGWVEERGLILSLPKEGYRGGLLLPIQGLCPISDVGGDSFAAVQ